MIKIESNIPLPPKATAKGRPGVYPFAQMAVGDSFFVPTTESDERLIRLRLSNKMSHQARKIGRYFTSRKVDGGIRIWRIS